MQPADILNNLSQAPCVSEFESTTENSSENSDSDLEILSSGVGDQARVIKKLKRTIRRKQTQINELAGKLASEKEKNKDKDDVIQSLKISIDAITQCKDLIIKTLQSQLIELQTSADLSKSEAVINQKNDLLSEVNDKTKKYECSLKEKDEHIAKLEAKVKKDKAETNEMYKRLQRFSLNVETSKDRQNAQVLLNCTKIPSIQFVTRPTGCFAAVFEDLPSAGPGWMVIQRRIDGQVAFETMGRELNCFGGFGDLSREFWLGCEKIHELTISRSHELYIELVDFDGAKTFARYDHFIVGGKAENYKIKTLGRYSGNAGDYLRKSVNNDYVVYKKLPNNVCGEFFGWWIGAECNLNGKYYDCNTSLDSDGGIWWGLWNLGKRHSLKSCKMLIQPTFSF